MVVNEPPNNGKCVGQPTVWWFPQFANSKGRQHILDTRTNAAKARELCLSCEGRAVCLEYSLHHEPLGIWGGLDEFERAKLRARRGIRVSRDAHITVPGVGVRNSRTVKA